MNHMTRILFVCLGNICRSPMAEFIFNYMVKQRGLSSHFEAASAATSQDELGNDMYPPAKCKLTQMGIPFSHRAARQIRRSDYETYDLIIGMDRNNVLSMQRFFSGDPEGKISMLLSRPVADPWFTGDFDSTYDDLIEGCTALLDRLSGKNGGSGK